MPFYLVRHSHHLERYSTFKVISHIQLWNRQDKNGYFHMNFIEKWMKQSRSEQLFCHKFGMIIYTLSVYSVALCTSQQSPQYKYGWEKAKNKAEI